MRADWLKIDGDTTSTRCWRNDGASKEKFSQLAFWFNLVENVKIKAIADFYEV